MIFLKKSHKIDLFKIKTLHSRIFHLSWIAFFLSFIGWFSVAPLMPYIRKDLGLTPEQVGNTVIASVSITILVRIFIGWILDKIGPRKTYSLLLIVSSIPIMLIGLANDYKSFLLFRLAIGIVGASFVITQYHTSLIFASNIIGTANATSAGWGNLGGGVVQFLMPFIVLIIINFGFSESQAWRIAMIIPGIFLLIMGVIYFLFTKDTLDGNFDELRKNNKEFLKNHNQTFSNFLNTIKDKRVWILFFVYGACFGIEITMDNIAVLYFVDKFHLSPAVAGIIASSFGLMNIFARSLGGILSDKVGKNSGLKGRVFFLGIVLFLEGISLILFSQMNILFLSIIILMIFGIFVKMSNGATYSVVPFIKRESIGSVAGIVGAGGNVGAVFAGFLFRGQLEFQTSFIILATLIIFISLTSIFISFSKEDEEIHETEILILSNRKSNLEIN